MTYHIQQCISCKSNISGELHHCGFSDMEAIYCERCPNVLLIKDFEFYNRIEVKFPNIVAGDDDWLEYNKHLLPYFEAAEKHLPLCSCGGHFRYMAAVRCPICLQYIFGKGYEDKPIYRDIRNAFITKEATYI